jgi:hypothetical protein
VDQCDPKRHGLHQIESGRPRICVRSRFFLSPVATTLHYYRIEPLGGSEINSTAAPAAYPNELMNLSLLDGFSGPSVPKAMDIQSQTPFA